MLDATLGLRGGVPARGRDPLRERRDAIAARSPAGRRAPGELRDLIDDEPRRAWIASAMAQLATTDVWQGSLELNAGGGRTIPVSAMGVIRRLPDGELDWIAIHARDISDLKEAEDLLRELASHDHLTGLANRALFNERLDRAVARHRRDAHRRGGDVLRPRRLQGHQRRARARRRRPRPVGDRRSAAPRDPRDRHHRSGRRRRVRHRVRGRDRRRASSSSSRSGSSTRSRGPITLPEVGRTAQPPERIRVGISIGVGVAGPDQHRGRPGPAAHPRRHGDVPRQGGGRHRLRCSTSWTDRRDRGVAVSGPGPDACRPGGSPRTR